MENKLAVFNKKKRNAELAIIFCVIGTALGIVIFFSSYIDSNVFLLVLGIILGLGSFIGSAVGFAAYRNTANKFKVEVLAEMFKELIPGTEYKPKFGLTQEVVYSTRFLKRADRFYSEDFLQGKLGDVEFISSDVKLEEKHVERTEQGTRTYYTTYFLGRIFRFDFNKEFVGGLQVHEKGHPVVRGYKKVKLESIDFNKKFKTFTNEEITAFYILTPDIMEAIFNLEKRNPGLITLSFHGKYLYVAINNKKDTFEVKMFKKIDESVVQNFQEELLVIKDFIITLKLNNKLFKKA